MPNNNKQSSAKRAPTVAMPTTSSEAHSQSGMDGIPSGTTYMIMRLTCDRCQKAEPGPSDTPPTRHEDGLGDQTQQGSATDELSIALSSRNNSRTMADVDESQVLGHAALNASTSTTNSKKTSKAAKSKATAGGGSSRKRDHDAMIDASQQDQGAAGGTAGPSSINLLASDSVVPLGDSKPQRVLIPKRPGHAQPAQAGQGQEPGGLNPPGQSDPNHGNAGSHAAAAGANYYGEAVSSGLRFLTDEALAWLSMGHQNEARRALNAVQFMLKNISEFANTDGFTKKRLLEDWDVILGGMVRIVIANRDGVQLHPGGPFIDNQLSKMLGVTIAVPAHPLAHKYSCFTFELPNVQENGQQAQNNPFLPNNVDGKVGGKRERATEMTAQIYAFTTLAQRNEDARNKQFSQLSNLLSSQVQAQAQGIGALHAAQARADAARDWEMKSIFSLYLKKQQILDSANEEE